VYFGINFFFHLTILSYYCEDNSNNIIEFYFFWNCDFWWWRRRPLGGKLVRIIITLACRFVLLKEVQENYLEHVNVNLIFVILMAMNFSIRAF